MKAPSTESLPTSVRSRNQLHPLAVLCSSDNYRLLTIFTLVKNLPVSLLCLGKKRTKHSKCPSFWNPHDSSVSDTRGLSGSHLPSVSLTCCFLPAILTLQRLHGIFLTQPSSQLGTLSPCSSNFGGVSVSVNVCWLPLCP